MHEERRIKTETMQAHQHLDAVGEHLQTILRIGHFFNRNHSRRHMEASKTLTRCQVS